MAGAGSSDDDAFYDRTVKGAGGGGAAAAGGAKKGKAAGAAKQEVSEAPGSSISVILRRFPGISAAAHVALPFTAPQPGTGIGLVLTAPDCS